MFKKDNKGFTIIEVLIVLAIAGLILLIVFLAVPALQRNSRNTQRVDDIARLLGASQEVLNNNNGQMSALTAAAIKTAAGDLAYYVDPSGGGSFLTVSAAPGTGHTHTVGEEAVVIYTGSECNGSVAQSGASRQLAAEFSVEEDVDRCQDS